MAGSCGKLLKRLERIEGLKDKFNDIIFHPSLNHNEGRVVYFGGDVQDYPENMALHRDNKHYLSWNLEITTNLLSQKFPNCEIFCVRPSRMPLKTFSCFDNFVPGDEIGSPKHELTADALDHLKHLLENAKNATDSSLNQSPDLENKLILIGFSKGCVVLNQILYAFKKLECENDEVSSKLKKFVTFIDSIYWLDGGHSGGSNTWITDKSIVKCFAATKIKARIHVSPYQMERTTRPWVGKEEKIFRDNLKKLGVNVVRKIHFENEPASLENHFRVLEAFEV